MPKVIVIILPTQASTTSQQRSAASGSVKLVRAVVGIARVLFLERRVVLHRWCRDVQGA